jgi:PAS domain S-box-containing protein
MTEERASFEPPPSEPPVVNPQMAGRESASVIAVPRSLFIKRLVAVAVVLDLLFAGLACLWLWRSRLRYEERANVTVQNLSSALAESLASTVDRIDLTVLFVVDEVERQLARGAIDAMTLNALIARQQARPPFLDGLRVVSAEGENRYGTAVSPGVRTSVADRAYFVRLHGDPNAGLVISEPVVGRVSKKWSIILARRVNLSDGSFAGLVYGTITLEHFLATFSSIDVGKLGSIALRGEDLALIARYPQPADFGSVVGQRNVSPEMRSALRAHEEAGTYRTAQSFDHILRTYSYRRVLNHPFYVNVGLGCDEYLAGWRSEVTAVSALLVIFILGTLPSSWLAYRVWMRRTTAAQKRQEAALRVSEANFRAFFASMSDLIAVTTPAGRIEYVNLVLQEKLGYSTEELMSMHVLDLNPAPQRREAEAIFGAARRHERRDSSLPLVTKSGGLIPVETRVWFGKWNGADCVFALSKDLTAEQEAQQRFERLFRNNPALMALFASSDLRFEDVNDAFLSVLGYSRIDIVGKTGAELDLYPHPDQIAAAVDQLRLGGRIANIDVQLRRKGGATIDGLLSGEAIRHQGRQYFLIVMLDITDHKRLEAELGHARKLEAVGQLAAGIAHEINTPTQYVGDGVHFLRDAFEGYRRLVGQYQRAVEILEKSGGSEALVAEIRNTEEEIDLAYLDENLPGSFDSCQDGVSRISTIVRAMKEFAHPDQREKAPADLSKALQTTLNIARNEYKYVANVTTELGDLPPVLCHVGDLNQVFLNLIVNAAHAIGDVVGQGGSKGTIRITTVREGDLVRIDIADTGSGIPEAIRHRIFDPFFTTKEVGKGSGQGLAIARSIVVTKHRGSLTFESAVGKGTTFTIRLPIGDSPQAGVGT